MTGFCCVVCICSSDTFSVAHMQIMMAEVASTIARRCQSTDSAGKWELSMFLDSSVSATEELK